MFNRGQTRWSKNVNVRRFRVAEKFVSPGKSPELLIFLEKNMEVWSTIKSPAYGASIK